MGTCHAHPPVLVEVEWTPGRLLVRWPDTQSDAGCGEWEAIREIHRPGAPWQQLAGRPDAPVTEAES